MAGDATAAVARHLRTLFGEGTATGLTDGQLLERFLAHRDEAAEAAFAALVERHGPMVMRLCRQVLGDPHDAQDAFQATFLVLARRARAIRKRDSVGSWLFAVAGRMAARARTAALRQHALEQRGAVMAVRPCTDTGSPELWAELHEEVGRLPEKYRAPIVLCYLEGQTHEEAAHQLRWPVGTVKVRLMRAREKLRARLTRRGLTLLAGVLTASWSSENSAAAALSTALVDATAKAAVQLASGRAAAVAVGLVSARVLTLTEGALHAMRVSQLTLIGTSLVLAVGLATGTGMLAFGPRAVAGGQGATGSLTGVLAASAEPQGDLARLQGTWLIAKIESRSVPGAAVQFDITGSTMTTLHEDPRTGVATPTRKSRIVLDETATPRTIDFTTQFEFESKTHLGIYKLNGDTLTICMGPLDGPRPTEFRSGEGQPFPVLFTAYRHRPQPDSPQGDLARLAGTWVSDDANDNLTCVISGSTLKMQSTDPETGITLRELKIVLDESASPRAIDFVSRRSDGTTTTISTERGIYKLEGDTLTICAGGNVRPTEFQTRTEAPRSMLKTYHRRAPTSPDRRREGVSGLAPAPVQGDLARLQGQWKARLDSYPPDPGRTRNSIWEFRGPSLIITATRPDGSTMTKYTATVKLEAPGTVDIIGDNGQVERAIYEIDGDTLWICNGGGDQPRPTSFNRDAIKPPAGIVALKRVRDGGHAPAVQ
ncbi:MAG TPA: sigma-70 family RNA polymerase sigma factor [Isosphaeraceae bacterium]|jgi:RNA polymerase sigma factor (sigma-70 family)|nr:sigma-70 family RNA polymerase sigma factor [Isosphaeraceae bacterium]